MLSYSGITALSFANKVVKVCLFFAQSTKDVTILTLQICDQGPPK